MILSKTFDTCGKTLAEVYLTLESEVYFKTCETLTRHIEKPYLRALFSHIQANSKPHATLT